jgi:heme/copper-type cytochrome/quinol oxidase subunit 1
MKLKVTIFFVVFVVRFFLIIFFVIDIGEEEEEDEKQRVVYNPDMIQMNKLYYSPVCYHSVIMLFCFVLIFHCFVF